RAARLTRAHPRLAEEAHPVDVGLVIDLESIQKRSRNVARGHNPDVLGFGDALRHDSRQRGLASATMRRENQERTARDFAAVHEPARPGYGLVLSNQIGQAARTTALVERLHRAPPFSYRCASARIAM